MSSSASIVSPELDQREAYETLLGLARRRTGRIPPELLARHVIEIYREAEWPVKRAALDALLRRFDFARKDRLRVGQQPQDGSPWGIYRTRPRNGPLRPYRSLLRSLDPLDASCDCPDFPRSSLGLCKHLLVVLDALATRPRKLEQALRRAPRGGAGTSPLTWDPIRPLHGPGDWLERVRLEPGSAPGRRPSARLDRARAHFVSGGAGGARIKSAWREDPARRLELVNDLLALLGGGARDAEPALRALLSSEKERLAPMVEHGARTPGLQGLRRKLYPYQREGVARFLATQRLLLADDMGLGKTIQAAAGCHALFGAGRVRRGLVIVPASLKGQWQREWMQTTSVPVSVIDGPPERRAATYAATSRGFLITNYEQVLRDLDRILEWDPDLVVLDEAQRIKNWATKTASCVKRLRPRFRLVLTGTPMENRLEELASIMDWVDDHALEPKWRLAPVHSVMVDGSRAVVGARHLDTLRERVAPRMLRRVRSEVLEQLPPRTDTRIPVDMTEAQRDAHDELDQPIAALVQRAHTRPLTQAEFLRLMMLLTTKRIIANGLAQHGFTEVWPGIEHARPSDALLASLSSPKLAEARALLTTLALEQERKVVVFSQWRRMLRLVHWALGDVLERAGLRALFFTGQESSRQRTRNLVDFHDDPAARVLFATDAGGVGLNLQRAASACVLLDLPWNPAVLEQRVGRIYRLGQTRPIDVYSLVSARSIEERIAALVADKRALFRGLFDGTTNDVQFDGQGSFLDSVHRLVSDDATPALPDETDETDETDEEEESAAVEAWIEDEDSARAEASGEVEVAGPGPGGGEPRRAEPRPIADSDVASLFARLEVQRTPSGGLRIEAPPEAADALASLFEGFAGALRRATR